VIAPLEQGRRLWLAVAALSALGLLLKLPVLLGVSIYWEDAYWFCLLAESLGHGSYQAGDFQPHARFFPGYPLLVAAADLVTARSLPIPALAAWVSAVAGSLAVALCLPLWRRWGLSGLGTAVALVGLLLSPAMNLYSALPLYESLFTLLVVVALLLEARQQGRWAALFAGLATVVKPEGALLVGAIALVAPGPREAALRLAIGGLPLLPWLGRNWLLFGSPLHSEYRSIYGGFQASGVVASGLRYLRHYPYFFTPLVLVVALPSILALARWPAALLFLVTTLLLHLAWPGDLERYVMPHAPMIFFLAGATVQRFAGRRPLLALGAWTAAALVVLVQQYPARVAAERTRNLAYGTAALALRDMPARGISVLGADHAALSMLGGHPAYSAWEDMRQAPAKLVASLVRDKRLRFHLISNYYVADVRFRGWGVTAPVIPLPDGSRLEYRLLRTDTQPHVEAVPAWLGLGVRRRASVHEVRTYEVRLVQPARGG
jgi:hypothetical protein